LFEATLDKVAGEGEFKPWVWSTRQGQAGLELGKYVESDIVVETLTEPKK
jgi:hypothetical protein